MVLFARAAKLGPGAYGARHARAVPSVWQWLLAVRETVVIKPSTRPPIPSPIPFLTPYTHLSLGWALTRLQASGVRYEKREVLQHLH